MLKHIKAKIISTENISKQVNAWRMHRDKIIFTNGCFDLIHLGHLNYLAEARALGSSWG